VSTKVIVNNGFSSFDRIKFFRKEFKGNLTKALVEWQRAIQKRAVFGMRKSKTGRLYKTQVAERGQKISGFAVYNGRRLPLTLRNQPHRASRRGEYPAADTGRLYRSIRTKVLSSKLEGMVYTNVRYGKFLEEKRPANGGRPFLSRAAKEKQKLGRALVLEALSKSARN